MRVTIVRPDNTVLVDGVAKTPIDCSSVDPSIKVIQWYGSSGWLEFNNDIVIARSGAAKLGEPKKGDPIFRVNEPIDSIAPWQDLIDEWHAWVPPVTP